MFGKRWCERLKNAAFVQRVQGTLHHPRGKLAFLALLALGGLIWFVVVTTTPAQHASPPVTLDAYGRPNVELRLVYPTHLSVAQDRYHPTVVTVYARALEPAAAEPLELILLLPDEALQWVDGTGAPVPGRLQVTPGYPDALPYALPLAHANTQQRGRLLWPYYVTVQPLLRQGSVTVPVPELVFRTALESGVERAARGLAASFARLDVLLVLLGLLALAGAGLWQRVHRQRRFQREKELATIYSELREQVKLERWAEARQKIERIYLLQPRYRDVDQLDTVVSAAETAAWRRDQLFRSGLQAYKARNWPAAVQAFSKLENETPYYRDVRFLRRTAALYADLQSRDRSRRIAAARELGDVADLLDMLPLVEALGDQNEVASAAEEALRRIGLGAFDALLGGLARQEPALQQRAYRLLEGLGQSARADLLAALRSNKPRITAQVARLLATLGARQELAEALLWAAPEHQEGIVEALLGEGVAAAGPLLETLLQAPPARQPVLLHALAALKTKVELDRRIEEALRSTRNPAERELLQQALQAPAMPFHTASEAPPAAPPPPEPASPATEPADEPPVASLPEGQASRPARKSRLLKLLDRH